MTNAQNENPTVTADETDEDLIIIDRAALKAKLKKFAIIGGAAVLVTGVVAVVVAKTRGSDLPEITDVLPTE